ncbi:MAG TPA: hypothetical protein PKH02_06290 [Bacteroidales bacterium]|nr:hypothetical protein [Bacteroidales bacterium]
MKRKVFYIISLIIMACTFTACDMIGNDCQVCWYERYDTSTGETTYTDEIEYCGTELLTMKAMKPETQGTVKISVKCR